MDSFFKIFLIYLCIINLAGALLAVIDKERSRRERGSVWRIPERTFLKISLLGGGAFTLLTMLTIRHKTRSHKLLLFKIGFFTVPWIGIIFLLLRGE